MKKMAKSIEPDIADLANGWLKSYNHFFYLSYQAKIQIE